MIRAAFFLLVFMFGSFISSASATPWGKTVHRATGEIAQSYLTKKAKRQINKLLEGESLAFVSTYADEIRSDANYRAYAPWHYVNFPFEGKYEIHPKSEKGDLNMAIYKCIEVLKDEQASKEQKVFHLKMLVHFIGDLHQPLHVGIADDRGGNQFQVEWFDAGTNLHTVWDDKIIESYEMSYIELAANSTALSEVELALIQSGSVSDWMYESRAICETIYERTQVGDNLGYEYMYQFVPVVRAQLQKGGIRLAVILNEVFQ